MYRSISVGDGEVIFKRTRSLKFDVYDSLYKLIYETLNNKRGIDEPPTDSEIIDMITKIPDHLWSQINFFGVNDEQNKEDLEKLISDVSIIRVEIDYV